MSRLQGEIPNPGAEVRGPALNLSLRRAVAPTAPATGAVDDHGSGLL